MSAVAPSHPNFRLPTVVQARRYSFHLALDMESRRFFGEGTVELELSRAVPELVLHANGPALISAVLVTATGARRALSSLETHVGSQTWVLRFEGGLIKGAVSLELEWAAKFSTGLQGLYPSPNGKIASTQFQAADARQVFPCLDEPAFKARWKLAVTAPKDAVVLSNGAMESESEAGENKRVEFAETPPLSSYLIALAVGDMAGSSVRKVGEIAIRTWSTPEKQRLSAFAQDIAAASLPLLQDYFGVPYAYGKVDQLGVPGFEAGAMENAGLIIYRETALLVDPATTALSSQKRVAETIIHELAHQWYGNLVTMEWWNDLWLNEAFATWMATKILDAIKPAWRVWLTANAAREDAFKLDALKSTHPIRGEVLNAHQASESFDYITYEKGGAILRMIESYLGEDAFREGIRSYMHEFRDSNTVAEDLWKALQKASRQPVAELANAWISQDGFPLVEVDVKGRTVSLKQRRFFSEPNQSSPQKWPVPVVLRYGTESGPREERLILRAARQTHTLKAQPTWVCANADAMGFYRVAYSDSAAKALDAHPDELLPAERVQRVADVWARVTAQQADLREFLDLAMSWSGEKDHAVLEEIAAGFAALEQDLLPEGLRGSLRAQVRQTFELAWEQVGWDPRPGEDELVRQRRAALLRIVGYVGRDQELVAQAQKRLSSFVSGDKSALAPDLQPSALMIAARSGDESLYEKLRKAASTEPDPTLRRRYLFSLAAFEMKSLGEKSLSEALEGRVPAQDYAFFVDQLLLNHVSQAATFAAIQSNWTEVVKGMAGPSILRQLIQSFTRLPKQEHLKSVQSLLRSVPEVAHLTAKQTVEKMKLRKALRDRLAKPAAQWFAQREAAVSDAPTRKVSLARA